MKIEVDRHALIGAMACGMMYLRDYLDFTDDHSKMLRLRMMHASFEKTANLLGILPEVTGVYNSLTGKNLNEMFDEEGFNDAENEVVSGFKRVSNHK